VRGKVADPINSWARLRGAPASTEVVREPPDGAAVLDVGDPGVVEIDATYSIPIERLWARVDEVHGERVVIAAGFGVRAALAVGILERAGKEVSFWRTGARP